MTKRKILFYISVVLFFLGEVVGDDDLQCPNNLTATSTLRKLKKAIFCGYEWALRPVRQHNETVDVRIRLVVKRIDFDDKRDMLTIHSWFILTWKDYHLVWEPAKYDNVDRIHVRSYSLWNPDLGIFTSADEKGFSPYIKFTICAVRSNGNVRCVPSVNQVTSCSADLTLWPYDTHTCNMMMGSWTQTGEKVNVSLAAEDPLYLSFYNDNREWDLISADALSVINTYDCCPNDTFPIVNFNFVIRRHSGVYAATVVLPAVVLMILTLTTYWMDSDHSDRMIVAVVIMVSHFIFLQYLGNLLPSNGDKTPLIITFYRDSLLLGTTALLTAVLVKNLRKTSRSVPLWASGVSGWVLQNRLGQVLVFHNLDPKGAAAVSEASKGEGAGLVDGAAIGSQASGWDTFTTLLDLVCFFITLFVYFILLLGFIP